MTGPLYNSLDEAKADLEKIFGGGQSYDICIKPVFVKNLSVLIVYVNGLVNTGVIAEMLGNIPFEEAQEIEDDVKYFDQNFNYQGKEQVDKLDDFLLGVLSGLAGFITENGYAFLAEIREYPGRTPEEPDNEKVIRGSRDGFAENISQNTALIRRRIRSTELRFEMHHISDYGRTDVAIGYLADLVNDDHLKWLKDRLAQIDHDGLTMADKSLEEWLFKQKFHPMPFVRYSERPDIVASHLLEGHIAIVVDTSPSVMLLPVTMFHLLQHAEEYRQAPLIGTVMRLLRYSATIMSFMLLPLWYLFATNEHLLPDQLSFLGVEKAGQIPLYLQLVLADLGIEFLRMAAIHTPTPLSTAMGLIAGIIIGQIAIDVGLFSSEVVLYTAIAAIFTFTIPNYELSISIKVFRFILLTLVALYAENGFFLGILVLVFYLASLKPINVPYLWPLMPFFPRAFARVLIRYPMSHEAKRPYVTRAKKRNRS